jgi:putative ABC transport system permease protein
MSPQHSNGIPPAVVVFAIALIGLIFVGLVAVAGFTVLAQRRLRGLGMLSSLGATDRIVRLVMVANGAVVGVVGALLGAVIGFAAWITYAPHLASSAHHRVAWTNLPWWLVTTATILAVVTATQASRRPARAIARTPVVAALSGRPAPAKGVHRSAVPGIVLLLLGPVLLASSGGWGGNGGKDTLFQLGGLLACAVGLLLLAPLAVAALGVCARRTPIAVRIALRDLVRYRARSGAALAASSFAVLIAMLITLIATGRFADPVDYFGPNLPANELVLYTPGNSPNGVGPSRTAPGTQHSQAPQSPNQSQDHAHAIATSLDSHNILALDSAGAMLVQATADSSGRGGPGTVYVATPALLAHYGLNPNAIDPRTILITSRSGLQGTANLRLLYGNLQDPNANIQVLNNPKIQTLTSLPTDTSAPNLLVTRYAVNELKLRVGPGGG